MLLTLLLSVPSSSQRSLSEFYFSISVSFSAFPDIGFLISLLFSSNFSPIPDKAYYFLFIYDLFSLSESLSSSSKSESFSDLPD